jgi:hypothetical protein
MPAIGSASRSPTGLSFDVADLLLAQSWARFHDIRMEVRADHGVDDEEFEEVLVLRAESRPSCRFLVWRDAEAVFVQPLIGRRQRYASVAEALSALLPKERIVLTDIKASHWPA